ncbi:MAG TPA: hypothetical protein VNZ64_14235 [Candidatus Acidoferrum sp.]|jgi:hypothetical protein|nr:hypothetical protein [Candidatus Acidoferrum sp.]
MTTTPEIELLAGELADAASPPANPRRNGKIARLPKETRDMLNHMLDDGLPYHIIIDELGEAGRGLNTQNITNWVKGGYQDYLKHQDAIDRAKLQVEFAIDLLREIGDADIAQVRRACNYVAALQLFQTLRDHGDETLKNMLQANPAKYLNIIHTLCHQSDSALKVEKHRLTQELLAARTAPPAPPSSQIKVNQAPTEISTEVQSGPVTPSVHHSITPSLPRPAAIHQSPNPSASPSSQIKVNQAPTEISTEVQSGPVTAPVHHSIAPSLPRPTAIQQSIHPLIHQSPNPPAFPSSQIKVNQAPAEISAQVQHPCPSVLTQGEPLSQTKNTCLALPAPVEPIRTNPNAKKIFLRGIKPRSWAGSAGRSLTS